MSRLKNAVDWHFEHVAAGDTGLDRPTTYLSDCVADYVQLLPIMQVFVFHIQERSRSRDEIEDGTLKWLGIGTGRGGYMCNQCSGAEGLHSGFTTRGLHSRFQ
jgi:hypothetical protein